MLFLRLVSLSSGLLFSCLAGFWPGLALLLSFVVQSSGLYRSGGMGFSWGGNKYFFAFLLVVHLAFLAGILSVRVCVCVCVGVAVVLT